MFYQLASISQWLTHSFIDCRLARDPHESQSVCMANRILFPPVSCIFPWWLVSFVAFGSIGMTEHWLGSLLAIDKQSKCRQTGNKSIFGFCSARCTVNYVEMRTRFFFFLISAVLDTGQTNEMEVKKKIIIYFFLIKWKTSILPTCNLITRFFSPRNFSSWPEFSEAGCCVVLAASHGGPLWMISISVLL